MGVITLTGNQPTRLFRPQPPEFFPADDVLAVEDPDFNIIHYREDIFATLTPDERKKVYFMRTVILHFTPVTTPGFI